MCITAHAKTETINWYMDGNTYATTQCETGSDIILPQTPYKYGYTFNGWFGYTPIEYLESTGNDPCYINTGIRPNYNTTKIEVDAVFHRATGKYGTLAALFGVRKYPTYAVGILDNGGNDGQDFILGSNRNFNSNVAFSWGSRNLFVLSKYSFSINNTVFSYTSNNDFGQSNYEMYMFAWNDSYQSGTAYPRPTGFAKAQIYSAKIYDNDVLVRDFIPVLDSNNVPCMYDKVEHKFYYNAGTGQFIAGPVIGGD